ncbi:hypothetical protein ACOBR2_14445 [Telmatobacter bradus]|uniref:hypothetical protein n=1 Tax=Telmatobacter bradus TaxID=474953 RepID=UPI003B4283D6
MNNTNRESQDDSLLNGVPYQAGSESTRQTRRWRWLATPTLALAMAVMLPSRAQAGIFDIFGELFSTIQNDMGAALNQINELTQEMQQLHQQIVWPLALVNQARGFVSNSINSYRGFMTQVFTLKSPSATLASPQQLETILHSRQSSQIPALQASFATNYGTVPAVNAASPQDRVMMDIDDALGQQSLKTTLIADQGQDVILATANQMENQVALSTPGSAPFITAQAQVANLRCQAFMQKMLAAELRQEAGRIAHDNVLVKRKSTATGAINSLITGTLSR